MPSCRSEPLQLAIILTTGRQQEGSCIGKHIRSNPNMPSAVSEKDKNPLCYMTVAADGVAAPTGLLGPPGPSNRKPKGICTGFVYLSPRLAEPCRAACDCQASSILRLMQHEREGGCRSSFPSLEGVQLPRSVYCFGPLQNVRLFGRWSSPCAAPPLHRWKRQPPCRAYEL